MKILLLSLYNNENLGLRLLQPLLTKNGHSCDILFFKHPKHIRSKKSITHGFIEKNFPPSEEDFAKLKEFISISKPNIIGLSVMSSFYNVAVDLTNYIRKISDAIIVWGGVHCTVAPEECVEPADYICIGEGAKSFLNFVDSVKNNSDLHNVKGFASSKNGTLKINTPEEPIMLLDELPYTDFSSENKYYLEDGKIYENGASGVFPGCVDAPYKSYHCIMTSWGCPFTCKYCINSIIKEKIRRRSVDSVIAELKQVKSKNPSLKIIVFYDDIFAMNISWCTEFAEKYKKEIDLPFWCYTHTKTTKYDILSILRNAGLIFTVMGIQSGNEKTRNLMGRKETDDEIIKAAKILHELKKIKYKNYGNFFSIYYDLIEDNPLENIDDLHQSFELFCRLPNNNFKLNQFPLTYFPNYPLTDYLLEKNLIRPDEIEGKQKAIKDIKSFFETGYDDTRDKKLAEEKKFYYILFSLTQFNFIPRSVLRLLEKSKFWRARTNLLFSLVRFLRIIYFLLNIKEMFYFSKVIAYDLQKQLPKLLKIEKRFTEK